ncbi:hypothetical protein M0804_000641 [Polistes exclamans]|nr:hypothetical protein M0804_000641 [Polistes exclamans]
MEIDAFEDKKKSRCKLRTKDARESMEDNRDRRKARHRRTERQTDRQTDRDSRDPLWSLEYPRAPNPNKTPIARGRHNGAPFIRRKSFPWAIENARATAHIVVSMEGSENVKKGCYRTKSIDPVVLEEEGLDPPPFPMVSFAERDKSSACALHACILYAEVFFVRLRASVSRWKSVSLFALTCQRDALFVRKYLIVHRKAGRVLRCLALPYLALPYLALGCITLR